MIYLSKSIQEIIHGLLGDDTNILHVYRKLQLSKHFQLYCLMIFTRNLPSHQQGDSNSKKKKKLQVHELMMTF